MRFLFICLFILGNSFNVLAQIQGGIGGGYFFQNLPNWEKAIMSTNIQEELLNEGFAQTLDLKIANFENYRIEFYLTGKAKQARQDWNDLSFSFNQYGIGLQTKFYPLSLEADCDCPTFSREAGILEKGLFLQVTPGVSFFNGKATATEVVSEGSDTNFSLGLGIGVDIGLSDQITISPLATFNRHFGVTWESLQEDFIAFDGTNNVEGSEVNDITQIFVGLRFGIRLAR
ncbi:MAG: hypothetical protein AAGJ18_22775 [Bacteroidota bacterium]